MLFGKHINKYYIRYALYLLVGLVAVAAVDYYQLKIPDVYGAIIDGLENHTLNMEILENLMVEMLIVVAVMVSGRFLWRICFFGSAIKVEANIREEMFDHLKDMSQSYYSTNKVGNLMSYFTNDLDTVQDCFGNGILMLIDIFGLGGLSFYKMVILDWKLSLFSLIPMALMVSAGFIVGKYMSKKWENRQEAFSNLSDYTQESFSGISVIKAFVKESKELLAFKKINKDNEKANVEYVKASSALRIIITLLIQTVTCLILGYGGYLAYTKVFSVGDLIRFMSFFNTSIWPLMAISELIDMVSRGKASLSRISSLLDSPVEIIDKEGSFDISNVKGSIEFKNVSFRYPSSTYDAIKNVSFKINAGENVGIIGKTGCGKTTLVDLLLRIYEVNDDNIFIDGQDINSITLKSLRNCISYSPQDNFLFSDTIGNNIAFAYNSASQEEIQKASKIACIHDDIVDFKDQYETLLGERGVTISGGQKQRTSIARALMKDSSILVLDDSVSAVDTKTEASILDSLQKERKGKTTILIAHRVTTIQNMDKIIFMDDGKIVAIGSHHELEQNCKSYANMVALQKLEDEKGGNA